jgi:hypothetical protein
VVLGFSHEWPGKSTLIAQAVIGAANEFSVSPVVLLAVHRDRAESGFDQQTVSVTGARGTMQTLPTAHPQLVAASKDLTEPAENVPIDILDTARLS